MITYCGLDIHKSVAEACVVDAAGQVICRERFELTPARLQRFCSERLTKETRVALEATTNTWATARLLAPHVAEVVVSNPLKTKAIAEANIKTDQVDALVLAQLLRCDFLPRVWQPDQATARLRHLASRRASLVSLQTMGKNRIHAVLHERLLTVPCQKLFSTSGLSWLRRLELDADGRSAIDSELRLLEALGQELRLLEAELAKAAYASAQVKLLVTLPGVDLLVAVGLQAALGDIRRFQDGAHAAAYLGLVPRTKQSADKTYHGPITKAGNRQARALLVQAAQQIGRHPGPLGHFFRKLAKRKNRNVAVVATARKLVVIAWQLLTKGEPYRYAQADVTERKLQKLRVKATGQKRKTGPKAGLAGPKLEVGVKTKTIKPLGQVYSEEDLPALAAAPAGESRTIAAAQCSDYVASLTQAHVQRKNRGLRRKAAPAGNTAATPEA